MSLCPHAASLMAKACPLLQRPHQANISWIGLSTEGAEMKLILIIQSNTWQNSKQADLPTMHGTEQGIFIAKDFQIIMAQTTCY